MGDPGRGVQHGMEMGEGWWSRDVFFASTECGCDQAWAWGLEERYFRTNWNQITHAVGTVEGKQKEEKTHTHTHARTRAHICTYTYIYIYIYIYMYIYIYIHTYVYICMYVCIYIYIHMCVYVCTHTHHIRRFVVIGGS